MAKVDLSISLLSFNNKELLKNCLKSVYSNTQNVTFEILLVDNGSKDGSAKMVKAEFPQVKLIANAQNRLYIRGHNQNLKRVKGRYFLILNEDTYLPPKTLDKMVSFMDTNPKVGLASCRQKDEHGHVDNTCSKFPHPIFDILESSMLAHFLKLPSLPPFKKMLDSYRYLDWNRKTTKQVDVLAGSFIIGRSEILKKFGYFDESLQFFYGEPDLCQRVKDAGYQCTHNGSVEIVHLKSKALAKLLPLKRYLITQHDQLVYCRKYFGPFWAFLLWLALRPNWLYWQLRSLK